MLIPFTPLNVFEELRYILELLAAEYLLFLPTPIARRSRFWVRLLLGSALLVSLSLLYFPFTKGIQLGTEAYPDIHWRYFFALWYFLFLVLTILQLRFCFDAHWSTILFRVVLAWCVQHIEYALVNELVGIAVFPSLRENHLGLYILASLLTFAGLLYGSAKVLLPYLKMKDIDTFNDAVFSWVFGLFLLVLTLFTFYCQEIFYGNPYRNWDYRAPVFDALLCFLILATEYLLLRLRKAMVEKREAQQLLAEREKQFEQNRQSIDIINRKVHDLKHQLRALETMDRDQQSQALKDVTRSIQIYDSSFQTGNEVIDTILTEKKLMAEKEGIHLTAICDGKQISFMDRMDVYVLFGNLLDNAIEAVSKVKEKDRKTISLSLRKVQGVLVLETDNYYEGELKMEGGKIVTSKADRDYHGCGLRSVQQIAQKYGGNLKIQAENQVFVLQLMLPLAAGK